MWIRATLATLLLTTSLAQAQVVSPMGGSTNNAGTPPPALARPTAVTPAAPTPTPSAPPATTTTSTAHPRKTMDERFAAANTTHDGKLTRAQASAGHLRAITRDYDQIDRSKKGYVTLDEVKAHQSEQRAARKAAREAKKPS